MLYQWVNNNSAINPVIVIDTNLRSYPDPTTGAVQLDPTIDATSGLGPIYVASSDDLKPAEPNPNIFFNPNVIKVLVSTDGGNSFSSQVYANTDPGQGNLPGTGNSGLQRDLVPQIAVSQGTPTGSTRNVGVQGGQVSLVWQNSDPTLGQNQIVTNTIPGGGAGFQFNGAVGPINTATTVKGGGSMPAPTSFDDQVSFTPAQSGLTFTNLDVTLAVVHPALSQIEIQTVPREHNGHLGFQRRDVERYDDQARSGACRQRRE